MIFIYSIKDNKADFGSLVLFQNDEIASRWFDMYSKNADIVKDFPQDFSLYCVGTYDQESGKINANHTPRFVCNVSKKVEVSNG